MSELYHLASASARFNSLFGETTDQTVVPVLEQRGGDLVSIRSSARQLIRPYHQIVPPDQRRWEGFAHLRHCWE